jgi:Tat protein secretion system quality control protein TatD with DNase activity
MVDSHCHLAGPEFIPDLDAVIDRAKDAGLSHALGDPRGR